MDLELQLLKFEELADSFNRLLKGEYTTVDIPGTILSDYIVINRGTLIVKAGYIWDGASGPTIDSIATQRAALFHDALYDLMRQGLLAQSYKSVADKLLRDLMIEDRQTPLGFIRAWYYYAGVWAFGASSTTPKRMK